MKTSFALKYNAFRTEKSNIIWCGAMCIAWTDFIKTNTKEPILLSTEDPQVQKQIDNFNESTFAYDDMDQTCFYVKSGYGKEFQALINKEVRNRFKNYSFQDLDFKLRPCDIISFAYICKKLDFQCKFQRRNSGFKFNGLPCKSFYAMGQAQKRQITVIQYKSRDRFCIRLKDRLRDDFIYLIKNSKITTVDKAIQVSIEAQKKKGQSISRKDEFQMPIIDISCVHNYSDITGLAFENEQLKGYILQVMCEALKLKIDENGALLQNRAMMVCTKSCVKKDIVPREFILDTTFWIVMKQTEKNPYFCMQVHNPVDVQE